MRNRFIARKKLFVIIVIVVCIGTATLLFAVNLLNNKPAQTQADNSVSAYDEPAAAASTGDEAVSAGSNDRKNEILLDVQPVIQDNYEGACEAYAAVALLTFYGYSVGDIQFVENYLHAEPLGIFDGIYSGPSLYSAFAGTPDYGYGVYAPSLEDSVNQYLADEKSIYRAKTETSCTLEELCNRFISKGEPVIIWGTTDMKEPYDYVEWVINYADDNSRLKTGDVFSWPTTEHCMVLIGYDEEKYYFADSLDATIVSYPKADCQKAFEALESQAIYLAEEKA